MSAPMVSFRVCNVCSEPGEEVEHRTYAGYKYARCLRCKRHHASEWWHKRQLRLRRAVPV